MNATMRFLVWGTLPVGAFIGGVLGNGVGLRPTLWIGAIGGLTAILPVLVTRVRTLDRIPEPSPDDLAGAVSRTDAGAIEPGHIPHAPMAGETTSERPR
jgi:hypothetical protein